MGYEARMIILFKANEVADEQGPQGETECEVWSDSDLTIDFRHITRLEKVVGERFSHLTHSPFRRAGICVMDCFFENIEDHLAESVAPEIIIRKNLFDPKIQATKKVGGRTYLYCWPDHLGAVIREGNRVIAEHNMVVSMDSDAIKEFLENHHVILHGPLLWASCARLAQCLSEAENVQTEGWQALVKDRASLAIARGWQHQLRELGEVGASALFVF